MCLLTEVENIQMVSVAWTSLTKYLSDRLALAASASHAVQSVLESDYPKLLRAFTDIWGLALRLEELFSLR